MQVKLLRAIQEKSIRPVGAQAEQAVDVRILSATHKDLETLVEQGSFRQDLFYRINVIKLDVPSLRERRSDIPFLAAHFLEQISRECDVQDASISSEALEALQDYEFPGNVRELENIIERAFTLCENDTIETHDLKLRNDLDDERATNGSFTSEKTRSTQISAPSPAQDNSAAQSLPERPAEQSLEDYLESIERTEIEAALQSTKWNRTAAAKKLGITFRALRYRLKKLEMD
jgi:two-component system response regulator PilR (NtrC family)